MAPDMPGFGRSEMPDHAFSFEYYVDAVIKYLKAAGIKNAVWCGLSMGGYLALRLYEKAPELCRGLVLCDTKAGADGNEAKIKRSAAIESLLTDREQFIQAQWAALVSEKSRDNTAIKNAFLQIVQNNTSKGIIAGLVALATRTDSTTMLSKVKVPTLIIVGEDDKVTPLTEAEIMKQGITKAQLSILKNTGHLSNMENAHDFNAVLSNFLTQF